MKTLGIIPARSGSKGIKNKNIAKIKNKTLLELAIMLGRDCQQIDDLYVTTDSRNYERIAKHHNAKSLGLRPKNLSGDSTKTIDVVLNLLTRVRCSYDYLVLLQPTSPIRTPDQITKMFSILKKHKDANAIVTIEKIDEPHPHKMKIINRNGLIQPLIKNSSSESPRQKLPAVFKLTGAIYIVKTAALLKEKTLLPSKTLGFITNSTVNIDKPIDLELLELLLKKKAVKVYGLSD